MLVYLIPKIRIKMDEGLGHSAETMNKPTRPWPDVSGCPGTYAHHLFRLTSGCWRSISASGLAAC
jgi:hypothetical protein